MKHRVFSLCVLVWILTGCRAAATKPDLSGFFQESKAAVFVFLSPECPLSQKYTLTLNELHARFHGAGIAFYGLVPGDGFQLSEIDDFKKEYKVTFPVAPDRDFAFADLWGATTTPEAFVVKVNGEIVYRGAIDNWSTELGQRRTVVTEHYLADVLNSFLLGQDTPYRETVAVGCFIERKR